MIDCDKILQELWDWVDAGKSHPLSSEIREHLEHCSACHGEDARVRELRACLQEIQDTPDAEFEARLRSRLDLLATGVADPNAQRFEADPELDGEPVRVAATLIDRRSRSWWNRPLKLVGVGAAAAVLLGLLARWTDDPTAPSQESLAGSIAATEQAMESPEADSSGSVQAQEAGSPIGVLADRAWQPNDSSDAGQASTHRRDDLRPVTTAP